MTSFEKDVATASLLVVTRVLGYGIPSLTAAFHCQSFDSALRSATGLVIQLTLESSRSHEYAEYQVPSSKALSEPASMPRPQSAR